jgi:hypothetical protein
MIWLALSYLLAGATSRGTVSAITEPIACAQPAGIECTLQTAGVREPEAMAATLQRAELRTVADVAELNAAETAELFYEMRVASVPLGDRARLRKVARGLGLGGAWGDSAMVVQPGNAPTPAEDWIGGKLRAVNQKTPGSSRMTDWASSPIDRHRRLQSGGGGFSIEVAAIAFTGLIGMVGYAVQARSAQKASNAQASLEREAAEREKAEAKAGKQLERVQLQMAEWVRPLTVESAILVHGWIAIARECKLLGYLRLYSVEYVPQPATPYIELLDGTNPAWWAAMGRAPYAQLPPEDLELLTADPALRSHYCELAATVLMRPLRRLSLLIVTKMHLNESLAPARLDSVLPGIGRSWSSLLGTLSLLYFQLPVYVGQFESLVARWAQERFDLLQPDLPGLHIILMRLAVEQLKDVATKEVELIGVSSGSRTAAGGLDYARGVGGRVGPHKGGNTEAET